MPADSNVGVKNVDERKVKSDVEEQTHDWVGVASLCVGWALTFSVVTASITTSNVAGAAFAPSPSLNTLPLAMLIISQSVWSFVLPAAFQALRGRLNVYRVTSLVGAAASALAAVACDARSFGALCVACLMLGLPAAAGQSFRFAALSLVPSEAGKPRPLIVTGATTTSIHAATFKSALTRLF